MILKNILLSNIVAESGLFNDGDWVESKDQDPSGDVRLVQLADIGDGVFLNKSNRFLTKKRAIKLKCTFIQKGDVLIARMPDPIGRACIFPGTEKECVTVVDVCIIRPNSRDVSNVFLKYLINSPDFRNKIIVYTTGTTRKRIARSNLNKIHFDLPKHDDQIRIASVLACAEKLIAKRKESIKALDELLKSTFLEMFGDPVRNEKGWEKKELGRLGSLDRGVSKNRPRNATELLGGEYPLIQTGEVSNSATYITKYTQTYSELGFKQSKMWKADTLCITIAANIAKTGILTFDACFPDSVVGFISDRKESNVLWVISKSSG